MSKTKRGEKAPGFEYWGRRPLAGYGPSKENKQTTHRIERARAKRELDREEREDFE